MKITTKYDIGDTVYDTLTKKKTHISGIQIQKGKLCCSSENMDQILYVVEDHLCHSYRKEDELLEYS